jgi:head-tail adaptor
MSVHSRRLVLEARTESPDGAGGSVGEWTAIGTHWGQVLAGTGRLERGEDYPRARVQYRILIRAMPHPSPSRPKAGQRFRDGERILLINAVAEQGGHGRYLVCVANEEVAS